MMLGPGFNLRRVLRHIGTPAAAVLALAWGSAVAQYPDRALRMIVPFTPGGTVDLVGRVAANKLGENLGRPVIVENRGGASGAIGTLAAVKSPADGYTLLVGSTTTISIRPQVAPPVGYDPLKDLTPLGLAAYVPHVLLVNPSVPARSVQELIAYAKAGKAPVSMANGGMGPHFLAGEIFRLATGVALTHISYKGGGEVLKDLVAGHVQFASVELSVASPLMSRGQLRAIGISAPRRDSGWPELPTVAEQGIPGFEITSWFGFFTTAGVPQEIAARLSAELGKAMNDPVVKEQLTKVGLTVVGGNQQDFLTHLANENAKWGKVIRATGADKRSVE